MSHNMVGACGKSLSVGKCHVTAPIFAFEEESPPEVNVLKTSLSRTEPQSDCLLAP